MHRTYFCFFKNGAAIKCHNTFDAALRQARQWKAHDPRAQITVETMTYEKGPYQNPTDVVHVELPMLVPALTPRHDWENGFEGTDPFEYSRVLVDW